MKMISTVYTYGYDTEGVNGKMYHHSPRKVFGNEPWEIEISEPDMTFEEMLADPELFIPHHLLEILYSKEELEQMNRYDTVKPDELIWMRDSTHIGNNIIHKAHLQKGEVPNHLVKFWKGKQRSEEDKKRRSELAKERAKNNIQNLKGFGLKFYEHFKLVKSQDPKLYNREHVWYQKHNKICRWEQDK